MDSRLLVTKHILMLYEVNVNCDICTAGEVMPPDGLYSLIHIDADGCVSPYKPTSSLHLNLIWT
jgi:hypothetical protein